MKNVIILLFLSIGLISCNLVTDGESGVGIKLGGGDGNDVSVGTGNPQSASTQISELDGGMSAGTTFTQKNDYTTPIFDEVRAIDGFDEVTIAGGHREFYTGVRLDPAKLGDVSTIKKITFSYGYLTQPGKVIEFQHLIVPLSVDSSWNRHSKYFFTDASAASADIVYTSQEDFQRMLKAVKDDGYIHFRLFTRFLDEEMVEFDQNEIIITVYR